MTRQSAIAFFLMAAAFPPAIALAGPDWVEHGDAGSVLSTAQITMGVGGIHSISGTLSGGVLTSDFEDMYIVRVADPATFSMALTGTPSFDAQLFIFNITLPGQAFGLLANDNTASGSNPLLTSVSTDGSGAALTLPGLYAIAVSGAGRMPVSNTGSIFFYGSPTEISGPDGPGGINPHTGWTGDGQTGSYTIVVTGIEFASVPAPGAGTLLMLGAGLASRRRRR